MPPIFIIGAHRSGTTLLRFMLSSHPRIYIPPESDFIPLFFRKHPRRPLSRKQVARILGIIFTRYRFVKEWQGPPPPVEHFFEDGAPVPSVFLDVLYSDYAQQNGATRWGDKTPIYSSYVPLLNALFPQAQFVHLIRDGRDVAISTLAKWGQRDFHIDIYFAARNWVRRTRQARRDGHSLGANRYYELHYETLVRDPEGQLRSLCAFLGEDYAPEMAAPHRLGQQKIPAGGFHEPVRHPPDPARIGRWQREMSPPDLRLFQHVAGDLLAELGYPLADAGEMTSAEKRRLTILRAKYEILQAGRRTATALGLLPPI